MSPADLGPTWGALERLAESVHELRARQIESPLVGGRHPFAALDWQGYRHLLIPMAEGLGLEADRGAGVRLSRRTLMDGGLALLFLDVACLKPHLNALFDVVCGEMLNACAGLAPEDVPSVCRGVVERWRELLEQLALGEAPLSVLAGAWGELWFVRELLRRGAPWVGLWQGPEGAIHDIAGPLGHHLEVKSTTSRGPLLVEVHGIQQLERPPAGRLLLGVLRLRHGTDDGESMDDMVRTCVAAGADHRDLVRLLGGLGINPGSEEFGASRFALVSSWLFEVDDDFPRLVPASFPTPLAPEVVVVSYQLDLTGLSGRALTGVSFDRAMADIAGAAR